MNHVQHPWGLMFQQVMLANEDAKDGFNFNDRYNDSERTSDGLKIFDPFNPYWGASNMNGYGDTVNPDNASRPARPGTFNPTYRHLNLHTVFLGPPGSGKTYMAEKVYHLYAALGFVAKNKFKKVTRSDLVGKYMGWSSDITKKLISKYKDGVIFVDEAYSLVNSTQDSYGKEVLTEIIEAMTNEEKNVTIFFAGYKMETLKQLFKSNIGLERRIHSIIETTKPTAHELTQIFVQQVRLESKFTIQGTNADLYRLFTEHYKVLEHNGGDIEVLLGFVKTAIMERLWVDMAKLQKAKAPPPTRNSKKVRKGKKRRKVAGTDIQFLLTLADVTAGFKAMKAMRQRSKLASRTEMSNEVMASLYN